uniref:Dihydropyrimidinase (DPYS) n=1 Tax=uncultured marine thaumarchaeote KM3_45_E05 TaxID=1456156 RepID=A0A075H5I4_9ARCH|nr:dihydropyrimidinase (DPYS) [uncultured marine thaumarchaeote KM3_45_E05]
MTYDSVIVGSHVITPRGMEEKNIVINDGKIVLLTTDIPSCDKKIYGSNLVSIPGVIDTHVHYGVYSPIDNAAKTESHAAAIGGVTTMMRMLRLNSSFESSLTKQLDASSKSHYVDYTIHASIFNEQQINGMKFCINKGISSFKIYMNLGGEIGHVYMDMNPGENKLIESEVDMNDKIVEKIVQHAASVNCPVLVHAEDYQECGCAIKTAKQKKQDGLRAWSQSRSPDFEVKSIKTVCEYARKYNCIIYFVHIGSTLALEQINLERQQGTRIFVETCPHYLTLSHENQDGYLAKVMPPIRSNSDVASVWSAIEKNQIDTIGTDHVANQLKLKLVGDDVWDTLAGFPGIGTSLPILLSEGVNKERINLNQLIRLTSTNAAKIFGLKSKGNLDIGFDADIAMIDLKKQAKVSTSLFGGFSDYLVYDGWNLKGWPVKTIVRGNLVAEDFEIMGKPGFGKFISRSS